MSRGLRDHPWMVEGRRRYEDLRETPVGQLGLALHEVQLRDRALTLAGQAFIALVPLLIVLASWLGGAGGEALGRWLVQHFDVEGDAEDAVIALFSRPPSADGGMTLLSVLILLVSVNSFGRALQRTFEAAWRLPHRGPKRALRGAAGTLLLLTAIGGVALLGGLLAGLPGGRLVALPLQLAVSIPVWWLLTRLLLSLRVSWVATLPGAILSATSQVLVSWAGAIWVPILIERDSERYGVVGVAVALITWLVVIAFVAVASTVVGAWASRMAVDWWNERQQGVPGARLIEPVTRSPEPEPEPEELRAPPRPPHPRR